MSEQDPYLHNQNQETERRLCECPECKYNLIQPIYRPQKSNKPDHWLMVLDCPNCDYRETGTFPQSQYDQLTKDLSDARESMISSYNAIGSFNLSIEHQNRNAEIERFVTALEAEAILPEDF